MAPVQYPHNGFSPLSLLAETALVCLFCLAYVVAKEVLVLNRFKEAWLSVLILPLYFVTSIDYCK
jgi:hypothetical protein